MSDQEEQPAGEPAEQGETVEQEILSGGDPFEDNEPSDEDLLREIQEEIAIEEAEAERIRLEMIRNGTLENATLADNAWKNETTDAQQLTRFQETVITTGSEVSVLLLGILALLFVVQAIRKLYRTWSTERAVSKVKSVWNEGVAERAENFSLLNDVSPKSYPVYNTEFTARVEYDKQTGQGASLAVLKDTLLKRAVQCVDRFSTIQRDGPGIRKNWNLDLLPKQVWDDFNSAQQSVHAEADNVMQENMKHRFNWGTHQHNIFERAKEIYGAQMEIRKREFHMKRAQRMGNYGPPGGRGGPIGRGMGRGQPPGGPGAPNANNFGSGFQKGFLNSGGPPKKKVKGKKARAQERKAQKEAMMLEQQEEQGPRRRKGKHRFKK